MNQAEFRAALVIARAHGHTRGRLPPQAEPTPQQRRYAKRIKRRVLESAMALVRERLVPRLEALAANASRIATTDATDDLGDILDEIQQKYFEKWTRREFSKVVRPVATEVENFQAAQLNRQLSHALGQAISVDVVGNEPWLSKAADEWVRENVALVKSIPTQFFAELEKTLTKEIADGSRWEDLAAAVEDRYSVSESRAELIARDQVGKYNGDLNRVRQGDLGITKFTWRTVGDERVRDEHIDRDGKTYEWSDPPDGETPGEPIQCRCSAEPDIESALEI